SASRPSPQGALRARSQQGPALHLFHRIPLDSACTLSGKVWRACLECPLSLLCPALYRFLSYLTALPLPLRLNNRICLLHYILLLAFFHFFVFFFIFCALFLPICFALVWALGLPACFSPSAKSACASLLL